MARRRPNGSHRPKGLAPGRSRRRNGHHAPRLLLVVAALSFLGLFGAIGGGGAVYWFFARDLPSPTDVAVEQPSSTKIYDRNGELLYEEFAGEEREAGNRTVVPLDEISPWLKQATISTEDADFYKHSGVNMRGLARAAWSYLSGHGSVQGGSSITQQLVKNVLIPQDQRAERSVTRKVREIILALEIERRYSKEQILELYLNRIFYGNFSYGIEAAARRYFGVSARVLDLSQASMLAGIPQAPAPYAPKVLKSGAERIFETSAAGKARQEMVLNLMVRHGDISPEQAKVALGRDLVYLHPQDPRFDIQAPHFVEYVRKMLEGRYAQTPGEMAGLRVITTLDLAMQRRAEGIIRAQEARLNSLGANNAALVALRPDTGEILAMVGSLDYDNLDIDGRFNVATDGERQPGSTFKIFTYVTAFEKGWTPATMVLDTEAFFPDGSKKPPYGPENVDGKFRGPVSVRQALAMSVNVPAVRTLAFAGLDSVLATAHKLGINTLTRRNTYGLSLTLGGGEVTLLDLIYATSVFANNGTTAGGPAKPTVTKRGEDHRGCPILDVASSPEPGFRTSDPVALLRVEDSRGCVLEDFRAPQRRQVLDPRHAYLITHILSDNNARAEFFGPNNPLRLSDRPAAAKTGTTDENTDNWTIGYTPDLAVGVWVGNTEGKIPMSKVAFGSSTAAPIWNAFMSQTLAGTPARPFPEPAGLVRVKVCHPSGLLPTSTCPPSPIAVGVVVVNGEERPVFMGGIKEELFIAGTEPKALDNLWRRIDSRLFIALPPQAADWARDSRIAQPPREFEAATVGMGSIASPSAGASVRGEVTISGTAQASSFVRYVLEYGVGLTPSAWSAVGTPLTQPVARGPLGVWDTRRLADGVYTLRLTVQDSQRQDVVTLPVTVDNRPPVVQVTYPFGELKGSTTQKVNIRAELQDNVGIARVDFFAGEQNLGYTTVAVDCGDAAVAAAKPSIAFAATSRPLCAYLPWAPASGNYLVYAVATDTAGNTAQSAPVVVAVQ